MKTSCRRKAVSPVLATILLMAVTYVAGVLIAGFAFGLFGTLSSGADIQITTVSRVHAGGVCTLTMTNVGSAPAAAVACTIYGVTGTVGGTDTVGAGGTNAGVSCTKAGTYAAGTTVSGAIKMSNGITIPFTAIWS